MKMRQDLFSQAMLMKINVLHLGFGRVGRELLRQIAGFEEVFEKRLGVSLKFCGVFKSKTQLINYEGLTAKEIIKLGESGFVPGSDFEQVLSGTQQPFLVIDTTASDETYGFLIKSLKKGGLVVLSNKKPLAGGFSNYKKMMRIGENQVFFETVVGAGLPIIKTFREMELTGDEILELQGAFSGTLGFIFSEIQKGRKFSEVVFEAKERGFTEPDPRDDLSGLDVARKTLILSRLLGKKMEMSDIKLNGLVPPDMASLDLKDFLIGLPSLDNLYQKKVISANKKGKALRFLVKVNKRHSTAKLQEVDIESDLGNLRGPDNIVVIKSRRYFKNPLVIKGPGAGIEVTAAGVFADILEAVKTLKIKAAQQNPQSFLPGTA